MSTAKPDINLSAVASRLSGVAPLAVVFDATATTAPAITSQPFHDIEYKWSFSDAGNETWGSANGAGIWPGHIGRNTATGAVAAHVFEKPGIYTVSVTATYVKSTVVNQTAQTSIKTQTNQSIRITVEDPDVVFAGTNTVCIANNTAVAGSGGCPSGAATPPGTTQFDTALAACIGTRKRCLFNRGDTFTSSATGTIAKAGPVTLGAYGSGNLPIIRSTVQGVLNINNAAVNDIRIMDLDIVGSRGVSGICIAGSSTPSNILVLRLTCREIGKGIIIGSGSNFSGTVIQDSKIYDISGTAGAVGIFGWYINSAFLGNYIGPFGAGAEHNIRLQPGQKVAISNNTITTPGAGGKQVLTIRALEHTPNAMDPNRHSNPDTQYVYISENKLIGGASSNQIFQIAPAAITQNNWIYDVIAERNWIEFGPVAQDGLYSEAVRLTVRNNICNATGGSARRTCFSISPGNIAGVPAPNENKFYNNTCYSGDASKTFYCVSLGYGSSNVITNTSVANNLAYAPLAETALTVPSGTGVSRTIGASGTHGNSSNTHIQNTNPNFLNASGQFNTPLDFKLPRANSYAIGSGVAALVWSDFFLAPKQLSPIDMGAVIH